MGIRRFFLFATLSLCCAFIEAHAADSSNDLQVIKLKNGFNEVHFDGLDQKALALIAHRENYNAHSYDVTTLYVDYKPTDEHDISGLQIIPIIENNQKNTLNLMSDGGADCMLDNYRLVWNIKAHETWLILATRGFGDSFADTQSVIFTFYKLAIDKEGVPGFPPFAFDYWKVQKSKQKYCDVDDAFQKELGLGSFRTDIDSQ